MQRVLHVIATLDRAGAEGQLTRLCLRLNRREFQPAVCCLTRGGAYEDDLRAAGIPVTILGKRGRYDVTTLGRLKSLMRDFRPDVVHTWLFTANTWGRIAARRCRAPAIIASERAADRWKGPFRRFADRRLAKVSAAIVANCEAVKRFCVEVVGVPPDKMRVIPNGLNLPLFDEAASKHTPLPERSAAIRIGVVARLEPQKGIQYLLKAMELLRDAELLVVGDGPDRPMLEAMARANDRVRFLGARTDVPAILRQIDVLALPSLWEGLPNAAMEAMAARLPIVATDVDGTPELVVEGETGLLVPPRDPEALARALTALTGDPDLRRRMGEAGRRRIESRFTEERMVSEYEALYRGLALRSGRFDREEGRPSA